jgi:hypothetical protein
MKSLNEIPNNNPQIFTSEIMEYILNEGFEYRINKYSYCCPEDIDSESCYYKFAGHAYTDWPIFVYIYKDGIGVDIDYECGGNSSTMFWRFETYSFEEAYDEMVDYVNSRREDNG